jgi:hypothetical protein
MGERLKLFIAAAYAKFNVVQYSCRQAGGGAPPPPPPRGGQAISYEGNKRQEAGVSDIENCMRTECVEAMLGGEWEMKWEVE